MADEKRILNKNGETVGYTIDRGYGYEETVDKRGNTLYYTHDSGKMFAEYEHEEEERRKARENSDSRAVTIAEDGFFYWFFHFGSYVATFLIPIIYILSGFQIFSALISFVLLGIAALAGMAIMFPSCFSKYNQRVYDESPSFINWILFISWLLSYPYIISCANAALY